MYNYAVFDAVRLDLSSGPGADAADGRSQSSRRVLPTGLSENWVKHEGPYTAKKQSTGPDCYARRSSTAKRCRTHKYTAVHPDRTSRTQRVTGVAQP